jgi:hypothetical protein
LRVSQAESLAASFLSLATIGKNVSFYPRFDPLCRDRLQGRAELSLRREQ